MFALRPLANRLSLRALPLRPAILTATRRAALPIRQPRQYTTAPPPDAPIPPEKWIEVLEKTASAPWLGALPPDHADRLRRAYTFLFQIVIYLGRPQEQEQGEQYLVAFESAPAPPESEIGRARKAVAALTRAIVQDISSIPLGSPLRTQHTGVFDIFGALQVLHDVHLTDPDGEVADWRTFWGRAQPIILDLGMQLDEAGFGLKDDPK
ncbi:hypothetical protein BD779DRAFT_1554448 [Infundibulicybe gibba]|nr:hypothetical protein BD779DRAFT_1554448 [Infundibulicybe gibba]